MYATWENTYIINAHLNFKNYSVSKYWLFFFFWCGSLVCQVGNKKGFEGDLVLVKRKVEDLEDLKGAC